MLIQWIWVILNFITIKLNFVYLSLGNRKIIEKFENFYHKRHLVKTALKNQPKLCDLTKLAHCVFIETEYMSEMNNAFHTFCRQEDFSLWYLSLIWVLHNIFLWKFTTIVTASPHSWLKVPNAVSSVHTVIFFTIIFRFDALRKLAFAPARPSGAG